MSRFETIAELLKSLQIHGETKVTGKASITLTFPLKHKKPQQPAKMDKPFLRAALGKRKQMDSSV